MSFGNPFSNPFGAPPVDPDYVGTLKTIQGFKINDIYSYKTFHNNKGIIYVTKKERKPQGFVSVEFVTYIQVTLETCNKRENHEEYISNIFEELVFLDNKVMPEMEIMNLTEEYVEAMI